MDEKLIKAVQRHRRVQGKPTGYFLVTFKEGQAVVSGETDGFDDTAAEIIRVLGDCMGDEPQEDEIGICLGTA